MNRAFWKLIFSLDPEVFPLLTSCEHQSHNGIIAYDGGLEINYMQIFVNRQQPLNMLRFLKDIELVATSEQKRLETVEPRPTRLMSGAKTWPEAKSFCMYWFRGPQVFENILLAECSILPLEVK